MFRFPKLRPAAAQNAPGFPQFLRVKGTAALVALIPPGPVISAMGTNALYIAVGQETPAAAAIGQQHIVGVDIALFPQRSKNVVNHPPMIFGVGMGEQVKADAQPFPSLQKLGVIAFHHGRRTDALLVGPDGNGRAVGIAARHHQHLIAAHPVVAGKNIRRQITPGQMPQMQRPVGIRPSHADKNSLGQGAIPFNGVKV